MSLRALTILQPWAWYISHGPKRIENRTWAPPASLRGQYLAIHAGKRLDRECAAGALEFVRDLPASERAKIGADCPHPVSVRTMPYGAIVGVARVTGWVRESESPWFVGPVGWVLDDVVAIDPVPCRGAQGLWTVPDDVLAIVRERWKAARASASGDRADVEPAVGGAL